MIKGNNKFIGYTSKRIYGSKVIGEGIVVQTTNNNYRPVLKLLKMIPTKEISNCYIVRSKQMKKALDPETYNKLILRSQGEVNN